MKDPNNQVSSWSSYMLLWVLVPLVLISGFVCLVGPTTSTWVSPLIWSSISGIGSSSSKGSNNYKDAETITYVELNKKWAGLQEIEEAVPEVSTFNLSSSSIPAKQVVEVHIPVRLIHQFYFIFNLLLFPACLLLTLCANFGSYNFKFSTTCNILGNYLMAQLI